MSLKMLSFYLTARKKIQDFMEQEKGGAEIIAMVLLIAIVLVLGGIFWDKIKEFFINLWESIIGKDPSSGITK